MAESVWTRPRRGKEQPALTRAQIVAEAIRLLDADGLDTLSMRNLGTRLGAGATSLYRHVANKDELIELVVDEAYGELENPAAEGWRGTLTAAAHSVRAMVLRHPWMASVLGQVGLSYLGPNVMRLNENLLTALEADGFTLEDADQAVSAVVAYVIGVSTTEAAWLTALARSGRAEAEWIAGLRPAALAAAEPYPRLRTLLDRADDTPDATREDNFTYGLNRILDGLEHRP
ncbi:TetR/AcrR family transcriptional regulator [Amycolatopsis sp. NBC_00345]|uniref:TetR/AcrR family transcriptional regulator n=1 Tax=Amycolatopsis sp. NBC_00345 TaxID=2975955 RepID=UPI002E26A4B6